MNGVNLSSYAVGDYLPLAGGTVSGTLTISGAFLVNDNVLARWGTDGDNVLVHRAAILAANTALTSVLLGTPTSQTLAANSFILSNVTASGDIAFYGNLGGNSQQFLFYDTSASVLYLLGEDIVISNNKHYQANTAAGSATNLLWIDGSDQTRVGGASSLAIYTGVAYDVGMWGGGVGTGQVFRLIGTAATDGQVNDSPIMVWKAYYDADAGAGVTSTARDFKIYHDMVTAGATPKSQAVFTIGNTGATVDALFIENNNGTIRNYSQGQMVWNTSVDSAAVADEVSLHGYEISAGHRALAISSEEVVVTETDETKFSHKVPVRWNGATYNIMLCAT